MKTRIAIHAVLLCSTLSLASDLAFAGRGDGGFGGHGGGSFNHGAGDGRNWHGNVQQGGNFNHDGYNGNYYNGYHHDDGYYNGNYNSGAVIVAPLGGVNGQSCESSQVCNSAGQCWTQQNCN